MIGHIPRATRIFIGLAIVTLLLSYLAINLAEYNENSILTQGNKSIPKQHSNIPVQEMLDTSDWKRYSDPIYPLTFLYPEGWTVETSTNVNGFYDIALTPAKSNTTIDIYISEDGYLGLDGLKEKPYAIGQAQGKIITENLIGVKTGEYYYTFDGTLAPQFTNEFYTLLHTVTLQ